MFAMAQVVDNSIDFFLLLSKAILSSSASNFRFLLWYHFKSYLDRFCNAFVCLCFSDSQQERGDNSDHAEMLLCDTADARMRILVGEY